MFPPPGLVWASFLHHTATPLLEVLHYRERQSIVDFILWFPELDKDFWSLLTDLLHQSDLNGEFVQCVIVLALIDTDGINPKVLVHKLRA